MKVRIRLFGLLLILLGAWGGIVAYAGPAFGYRMDPGPAWQWTTAHWQLHAAPGAAVVLGGLLVLFAAPRVLARLGAALAVLGGLWLILGPLFASLWLRSAETQLAATTLHAAARPLGYHYGTGALIVAVAAYAWGACNAYRRTATPYPPSRPGDVAEDDQLTSILGRWEPTET